MKKFSVKIAITLFLISLLVVVGYEKLPLWRNFRANSPFGGELLLRSGIRVATNKWVSVDEGILDQLDGGSLRDKYGSGPISITSKKRFGEALEIWIVKQ